MMYTSDTCNGVFSVCYYGMVLCAPVAVDWPPAKGAFPNKTILLVGHKMSSSNWLHSKF